VLRLVFVSHQLLTQQGMRLYPSGYFPEEQAVFRNSRFVRNRDAIFVHKCWNVSLVGGIYGDSRVQIDVDRADNIHIQDLTVVGMSDEYLSVMETQGAPSICDLYGKLNRGRSNTGIQLHTFVNEVEGSGAVIKNVTFVGFGASDCDKVAAISFDDEVGTATIVPGSFSFCSSNIFSLSTDPRRNFRLLHITLSGPNRAIVCCGGLLRCTDSWGFESLYHRP